MADVINGQITGTGIVTPAINSDTLSGTVTTGGTSETTDSTEIQLWLAQKVDKTTYNQDLIAIITELSTLSTNKVDKAAGMGLSQENFTTEYKEQLDNLATPVQSDWNEADTTSLAYIKNKPVILTINNVTNAITSSLTDYASKEYLTSQLESYVTSNDLTTTLSDYATQEYVASAIANFSTLTLNFVDSLPDTSTASANVIYLIKDSSANKCDCYIFDSGLFWQIGSSEEIDLSGYLPLTGGTLTGNLIITSNEGESITLSSWGITGNGNSQLTDFASINSDVIKENGVQLDQKYALKTDIPDDVDLSGYATLIYVDEQIGDIATILSSIVEGV